MSRQEVIDIINQLPDEQLQRIIDYIKQIFLEKAEVSENNLSKEQEELLNLLNYTIDSGRGDFAEQHDHYIYGKNKR